MKTSPDISESLNNLNLLIEYLNPSLSKHGLKYEAELNGFSSGGQFANGFFIHDKIKIGLIYRQGKLGSVNYEGKERNLSHDDMFIALGKEAEKKLFYNKDQFYSYTLTDEDVNKALLLDLENVIIPYIENTSIQDINSMMNGQPKWWEK